MTPSCLSLSETLLSPQLFPPTFYFFIPMWLRQKCWRNHILSNRNILVALAVDAEGVVVVVYAEGGGVVVTVDPDSGGIVVALDAEGVVVVVDAEGGGIVVVVGKMVEH